MLPDAKWLDALKLPLRIMLGVALSCGALLIIDGVGWLDLDTLGKVVRPAIVFLLVVSSMLSIVAVGDLLLAPRRERQKRKMLAARREVRRREHEEESAKHRAEVLARLDHLSEPEISYVADALRDGSPSFYTYVHSPAVSIMMGKGMVWTPGGDHNQDHYPFSFHDFVWEALLARKDAFITQDDANRSAR